MMTKLQYMSPLGSLAVFLFLAAVIWLLVSQWRNRDDLVKRNSGVEIPYYIAYVLRDGKEILLWDDTRSTNTPKRGEAYNKICEHFEKTGEGDYRVYTAIHKRGVGYYSNRFNLYDYYDRRYVMEEGKNHVPTKRWDKVADLPNFEQTYEVAHATGKGSKLLYEGDPPEREWCDTHDDAPYGKVPRNDCELFPEGFREKCKTEEHLAKCREPKVLASVSEES